MFSLLFWRPIAKDAQMFRKWLGVTDVLSGLFLTHTHTHTLYVHVSQARISADEFIYNMSMYIYI